MPSRSSRPPEETTPIARRVPIAMSVALEVLAELRARDRKIAQRIVSEVLTTPPPPPRRRADR